MCSAIYKDDMVGVHERVYMCLKRKGRLIGDGKIHPYRHPFESTTKIAQSMNKHATIHATRKTKKHRRGPDTRVKLF